MGYDSSTSSRMPSLEGHPDISKNYLNPTEENIIYSWMVEECILSAYSNKSISCPKHSEILLSLIAPDIIFMDLGTKHLIRSDDVKRGKMLGRGAFGFVFQVKIQLEFIRIFTLFTNLTLNFFFRVLAGYQ